MRAASTAPSAESPAPSQFGVDACARTTKPVPIVHLRDALRDASFEELPGLIEQFEDDGRAQATELAKRARNRYEKEARERARVEAMYELMGSLAGPDADDGIVVGVDEVGRGSVAGPLTVAAVALSADPIIWGLNDSKKLTPARREELASRILTHAIAVGIAHIEPGEIDACGMAASLRVAMRRAIADTGCAVRVALIDGVPVHVHPGEVAVVHGDARVACIAAASIVAKVTRDAIMVAADDLYPGYCFAESKGYASPEHIEAIRRQGLSPYHRASFCQNFLV